MIHLAREFRMASIQIPGTFEYHLVCLGHRTQQSFSPIVITILVFTVLCSLTNYTQKYAILFSFFWISPQSYLSSWPTPARVLRYKPATLQDEDRLLGPLTLFRTSKSKVLQVHKVFKYMWGLRRSPCTVDISSVPLPSVWKSVFCRSVGRITQHVRRGFRNIIKI